MNSERHPRETIGVDRTPIATPATLWLDSIMAMFEWYGTIVKLAFGLGRMDAQSEAPAQSEASGMIAPSAPKLAEPVSTAKPDSLPSPVVEFRPKRKKRSARGKNRSRSKISSITRRRRAA